jgi:hypothetical protein
MISFESLNVAAYFKDVTVACPAPNNPNASEALMVRIAIRHRRNECTIDRQIRVLLLHLILVLAFFVEWVPGQDARPPANWAGAAPLARHVPRKDLLAYLEFDGLDAHAGAWRASAAFKLLNDTKLGSVLEDLALQGIELIQDARPRELRVTGAEIIGFLKHIVRNGFVLGVTPAGVQTDARDRRWR